MPIASMIGGTAVTTALASRSTSGIETGRTADPGPAGLTDVIGLSCCQDQRGVERELASNTGGTYAVVYDSPRQRQRRDDRQPISARDIVIRLPEVGLQASP